MKKSNLEENKLVENVGRKKNMKKIFIVSLIMLIIVIYCIYSVVTLIKKPTNTFVIENGTLYNEENTVGYVIRQETVIQGNNYKNGMVQIKAEGERVAKGEAVYRYYSNNEENLIKKIQELDIKIQDALESRTDLFSNDIKLLENQIEEKLYEIGQTKNIKKIAEYKKDINSKITKKAKIAGELSPSGSYVRKLIEERSSYENSLNSGAEYINAGESGIVSYRVDGLENVLTPDSFSTLNKKMLEDLKLKTGEIIATSEESAKIVNNFECYVATSMTSQEAKNAKIGDSVKLRLSNSMEVSAKVEYIIDEDNERLIIFKVLEGVELLASYRKISFDVIWWSYTGLKVPNDCLIVEKGPVGTPTENEDVNYIVRKRAGYTDKIIVKVLKQNSSYSIIRNYETSELKSELGYDNTQIRQTKSMMLYDEILLNPNK